MVIVMIKLAYIHEFVTLAETLSFSRAAELTYITQPALSRHIAILEEEMGTQLFVRNSRSVKLTAAGKAVYEHFCKVLSSYKEAKNQAELFSSGKTGVLKIHSPYYCTEDFTEPLVLNFLKKHPACDIQVISCQPNEGMRDMQKGLCDILISSYVGEITDSIRRVPFAIEKLGVVLDVNHPLAQRNSVKLEELKNDCFIFLNNHEGFSDMILGLLKKRGIKPQPKYTQQIDTLGMTIKQIGGVGIMPFCVRHMDRSYIKVVLLEDDDCELPMCIYYRTDNECAIIPQFVRMVKNHYTT